MSTSLDKLNELVLSKVLTKVEIDELVKELKPVLLKQLRQSMLKAVSKFDFSDVCLEALEDDSWDIAKSLMKQVDVELKLKKEKK